MKARYKDKTHLVRDKNSLTNPLDNPSKDERIVKEAKIRSNIGIRFI